MEEDGMGAITNAFKSFPPYFSLFWIFKCVSFSLPLQKKTADGDATRMWFMFKQRIIIWRFLNYA